MLGKKIIHLGYVLLLSCLPTFISVSNAQTLEPQVTAKTTSVYGETVVDFPEDGQGDSFRRSTRRQWYGNKIILVELLDLVLPFNYLLGAPIIHFIEGESGNAMKSLALRLGLPTIPTILYALIRTSMDARVGLEIILFPIAGIIAAIVFDCTVVAYKEVQDQFSITSTNFDIERFAAHGSAINSQPAYLLNWRVQF